jgi:hypothetical protein
MKYIALARRELLERGEELPRCFVADDWVERRWRRARRRLSSKYRERKR